MSPTSGVQIVFTSSYETSVRLTATELALAIENYVRDKRGDPSAEVTRLYYRGKPLDDFVVLDAVDVVVRVTP